MNSEILDMFAVDPKLAFSKISAKYYKSSDWLSTVKWNG